MTRISPAEGSRRGAEALKRVPPAAHADLPTDGRADPVSVLTAQDVGRIPELVPLRHERMAASPFSFYRGAAAIMAADLARTPVTGLDVQLCGDAHLSNFGTFASPERHLLFDINDFDETLPGPWEWDLKRLVASLVVAGRENSFSDKQVRTIVTKAVRRYQQALESFAAVGHLQVWYARVDVTEVRETLGPELDRRTRNRLDKAVAKARSRDHQRSLAKLTEVVDGRRRLVGDPPLVVPVSDLVPGVGADAVESTVQGFVSEYAESLQPGYRELVRSYSFVDLARKVVGVGSVGTRCWVVLMRGRDDEDPLFLQVKEARPSVLAAHLGRNGRPEGARVVTGQRIMQAAGDAFLGWGRVEGIDGVARDFYVRQLHDWKGSATVEGMSPKAMRVYGQMCAWTLARAHARSGDRFALAAYLESDGHAGAFAEFAEAYADLNQADYDAFVSKRVALARS